MREHDTKFNERFYAAQLQFTADWIRASRLRGSKEELEDVAGEMLLRLVARGRGLSDGEPARADRPLALHRLNQQRIDEYRKSRVRHADSLDARVEAQGDGAMGRTSATDPLVVLVRREDVAEELEPLRRFRAWLTETHDERVAATVVAALVDGVAYDDIVATLEDADCAWQPSGEAFRKMLSRSTKRFHGLGDLVGRRDAPADPAERGGGPASRALPRPRSREAAVRCRADDHV